jgi:hypothetical protein
MLFGQSDSLAHIIPGAGNQRCFVPIEIKRRLPAFASSAATTAASAISTIVTAASAAPTASGAFSFGPRFVDIDGASADLRTVQGRDRLLTIFTVGHFDESEATRPAGVPVSHDAHPIHLSVGFESLAQFIFVGVKAEIPYKNILHASAPCIELSECELSSADLAGRYSRS